MAEDAPLKSAYELAMERLRAEDREHGVERPRPLSPEQKRRIADLRQRAQAKLAEIEILHRKAASSEVDPEKRAKLEEQYDTDRRRIATALESDITGVRGGS